MTLQHDNIRVVIGPPGTGKTTELMRLVEAELRAGVYPERICFVSHSRRAVHEARRRVESDLGHLELTDRDLRHFCTIHSLAMSFCASRAPVVTEKNLRVFAREYGYDMTLSNLRRNGEGRMLLDAYGLARNRLVSLEDQLRESPIPGIRSAEVRRFQDDFARFKDETPLLDFSDMLERFVEQRHCRRFDVLLVDEAQDLTPLQWRAVQVVADHSARVYVAGDDDQAIYNWAGTDTRSFMDLPGEKYVLQQSHRLSRSVHAYAGRALDRIRDRTEKTFYPRDVPGQVRHGRRFKDLGELIRDPRSGSWLILGRTNYVLRDVRETLWNWNCWYGDLKTSEGTFLSRDMRQTVRAYSALRKLNRSEPLSDGELVSLRQLCCHERLFDALRDVTASDEVVGHVKIPDSVFDDTHRLGKLIGVPPKTLDYVHETWTRGDCFDTPRVLVGTIHAAKGAEADNVVVFMRVTPNVHKNMQDNPDNEFRVLYVGLTRARQNLYVITCPDRPAFDVA